MGHELGLGLQGLRGLDGSRDAKGQDRIWDLRTEIQVRYVHWRVTSASVVFML